MSAAVNRAAKLEPGTNESTQPAETCIPGKLEGQPAVEVAEFTEIDRGMTPLMRAASDGLAGTVRALLDRGAEVNAKRSDGFNALALAAFFGHSQVVWLLLENGADLAATGRSETPPERWADARGFFDIAETLKEARVTEQVEVSSLSTAVIDESARFARSAEKDQFQQSVDAGTAVEAGLIAEAKEFKGTLATGSALVADENDATISGSQPDVSLTVPLERARQQPVIEQPLRALKTLPEIQDPPRLEVPRFHPGSVFVARITSSRNTFVALILAVLLICSGTVGFLFPQIRKSLGERRAADQTNSTNTTTAPGSPLTESGTKVIGSIETAAQPVTEPTSTPVAKDIAATPVDTVAAAPSVSRTGTRTRRPRAVPRAIEFKQQTVAEEQPKPAPITVETSRSRSVLGAPAGSDSEVSISPPQPFSTISGKPKSKVIQWP